MSDSQVCALTGNRGRVSHGENLDINIKLTHGGLRSGAGRPAGSLNVKPAQGRKPQQEVTYEAPLGLRWYVAETHPSAERQAVSDMARQGWNGYLPLTASWRPDPALPNRLNKHVEAYFRGFVFVEFDRAGATWGTIRDLNPAVRSIIRGAGGRPVPAPIGFVERLKEGDVERLGLLPTRNSARKVGTAVRVMAGLLEGHRGEVVGCNGIMTMVSVEMFGRTMPVEVGWTQVEVVGA